MNEDNEEKETIELTEKEKCEKFVDSWLFPDHKENTEEEKKAHELMDIWHKEWLAARKEKRSVNILVQEGQKALEKAWNRRKQLHPQPVFDQLQREHFNQLKEEEEQKLEETRRRRQADLTFQHSQIPLMNKDEIGIKSVELQIESLKCFIRYPKTFNTAFHFTYP
jgi:hypothetical protein